MSELKRTHTRHVALSLIESGHVHAVLISLRDRARKRRYVLAGGVLGGPEARAVREIVANTPWAFEQLATRVMAARQVKLTDKGKATLAAWDAEFGEISGFDKPE